eukprot:1152835-Pelagomonas_calceolata.AAC.2
MKQDLCGLAFERYGCSKAALDDALETVDNMADAYRLAHGIRWFNARTSVPALTSATMIWLHSNLGMSAPYTFFAMCLTWLLRPILLSLVVFHVPLFTFVPNIHAPPLTNPAACFGTTISLSPRSLQLYSCPIPGSCPIQPFIFNDSGTVVWRAFITPYQCDLLSRLG